jgi:predicted ATPase
LERGALRFEREESLQQKLSKLEGFLVQYGLPLTETLPLFATLLSLPLPGDYAPLTLSPEQQKQQTLHALVTILLRIAVQQPVLFVMEDLHWVDPSTLELLSLLVDQGPTTRILALLTCRSDFSPPWTGRAHLTQVTVTRLPHRQAMEVIHQVAHGKVLPPEVIEQIVAKTDGVPLFVEELTKMVLESGLLQEREDHYELTGPLPPLAIPTTLHDSLMARLDRLTTVKSLAQLGATLGRAFSYELLHAVMPWDEETLRRGLHQLVEAELLYQQGLPPYATYLFKHALIQDAAYQSLLRSTRQQHHQRIAKALEAQFPEIVETQPELLAHHYTEGDLAIPAVGYWQRAGERSNARSAYVEAIAHLTKGLEVLKSLPETPEHIQHELLLQTTLGPALMAVKGYATADVEAVYNRALVLCRQVGETPQLFVTLMGLWQFYLVRAQHQTARELGERLLSLAQNVGDPALLVHAHRALGEVFQNLGEFVLAQEHLAQGSALYDPQHHRSHAVLNDPGVFCFAFASWVLWWLGYPEQALQRSQTALTLAREMSHPPTLAAVRFFVAMHHQARRERQRAQEQTEAGIALAREQGLLHWVAYDIVVRGWALAVQGQWEEGIAQIQQGLAVQQTVGSQIARPTFLSLLAEAHAAAGQVEAGLAVLAEALALVDSTQERYWEAEIYRLKGEMLLQQAVSDAPQAETCFHQSLAIARRQQAKSWELRTAMSLSRLWQQQGKQAAGHALLAPIYAWFTEGFETADLQEAKVLLEGLKE